MSVDQRPAWLATIAAGDPALAADLQMLLAEQQAVHQSGFLEGSIQLGPYPVPAPSPSLTGQILGAYQLVSLIGQGGMGSVWLAERCDGRFEGLAAIKLRTGAVVGAPGAVTPTIYCVSTPNSLGCLPAVSFTGCSSASATSGFTIGCHDVRNSQTGVLMYSTTGSQSLPFQGGTLCLRDPIDLTPAQSSGGMPHPWNLCDGSYSIDFNAFAQGALGGTPQPALSIPGTAVYTQWMAKDPVPAFRTWLVQNGHATDAELAALESAIEKQLDEAVEFALSSAEPDVAELRRDVFAEELTA